MISADRMLAVWNTDAAGKVVDFLIVDIDHQNAVSAKRLASAGASDENWMGGEASSTPLGLYAYLATAYGFGSREGAWAVLHEFRKVEA